MERFLSLFSFDETSWRKYSERQRTLRDRALLLLRTRTNIAQFAPPGMPFMPMGPSPIKSENFNRSNPPPVISSNGTIAVPNNMGDRRGPPGKKGCYFGFSKILSRIRVYSGFRAFLSFRLEKTKNFSSRFGHSQQNREFM